VIAQPPNAAIVVFLAALALRLSPYDRVDTELRYVGSGALIVWGLDEAVRGVNPFRRALGGLVLLWQAAGLALRWGRCLQSGQIGTLQCLRDDVLGNGHR